MKFKRFVLFILLPIASPAFADCQIRGGSFYPAQNDAVAYDAVVTGDGSCQRTFTTHGLMFTGISIVAKPQHGSLNTKGVSSFSYRAKAGYKGADIFTVKACASGAQGAGCSTLSYNLTIQ